MGANSGTARALAIGELLEIGSDHFPTPAGGQREAKRLARAEGDHAGVGNNPTARRPLGYRIGAGEEQCEA